MQAKVEVSNSKYLSESFKKYRFNKDIVYNVYDFVNKKTTLNKNITLSRFFLNIERYKLIQTIVVYFDDALLIKLSPKEKKISFSFPTNVGTHKLRLKVHFKNDVHQYENSVFSYQLNLEQRSNNYLLKLSLNEDKVSSAISSVSAKKMGDYSASEIHEVLELHKNIYTIPLVDTLLRKNALEMMTESYSRKKFHQVLIIANVFLHYMRNGSNPNIIKYYDLKINSLFKTKQFVKAKAELMKFLKYCKLHKIQFNKFELLNDYLNNINAQIAYNLGEYTKAKKIYLSLIDKSAQRKISKNIYLNLARVYMRLKDYDLSLKWYNKVNTDDFIADKSKYELLVVLLKKNSDIFVSEYNKYKENLQNFYSIVIENVNNDKFDYLAKKSSEFGISKNKNLELLKNLNFDIELYEQILIILDYNRVKIKENAISVNYLLFQNFKNLLSPYYRLNKYPILWEFDALSYKILNDNLKFTEAVTTSSKFKYFLQTNPLKELLSQSLNIIYNNISNDWLESRNKFIMYKKMLNNKRVSLLMLRRNLQKELVKERKTLIADLYNQMKLKMARIEALNVKHNLSVAKNNSNYLEGESE